MAKGTHATLGNDCKPTANELIVLPKPGNFTITSPIDTPIEIEREKPITRRYMVIPILVTNVKSLIKSIKDPATIAGDGSDTSGQMPSKKTNCQIPIKAAMNNVTFAKSSRSIFPILLFTVDFAEEWVRTVPIFRLESRFCISMDIFPLLRRDYFLVTVSRDHKMCINQCDIYKERGRSLFRITITAAKPFHNFIQFERIP
jgi:hypothetical protein